MNTLGLVVFIIIISIGQLYFSHKRKEIAKMIEKDRIKMNRALRELKNVN